MARRRPVPLRLEALEDRTLFAVGLVAAFGFDETAGLTAADASGTGNVGTLANGPIWSTAGKFGGALSFDGVNDWVTVADAPPLDLTTGMTLEAWVRPSTLTGWRTVFTKEIGGGEVYQLYASDGVGPATYLTATSGGDQGTSAGGGVAANVWTHLASTFDGSVLRLYVNGSQVASRNVSGTIVASSSPLRIGGNAPWGEYYSGLLDELRVYNRALSAAEIVQDMGTAINSAGPDVTPPTVTSVTPTDGATAVAASIRPTATFSEAVDPATITTSSFELRNSAGTLVAATVSYDAASRTATLTPSAALANSATFTVRVKGGIVKDLAGNALAADRAWSFTTTAAADVTPPTITAVSPADGATNVAASVHPTATFSEAIDPTTLTNSTFELRTSAGVLVAATVSYDAASRTATLTPSAALAGSASFTVRVKGGSAGVKDLAGNALAADRVWSFTTTAATGGFVQSTVFGGLTNPTVVRFAPDGRVFVAEKRGTIEVFDNLADTTPTVFADLNASVFNAWDRGLLGMALAPDFATNPYVYVLYTLDANPTGNAPVWGTAGVYDDPFPIGPTDNGVVVSGRLSRLRVGANGLAGAEEVLIDQQWLQQFPSHSIGPLQFGPDGALYASAGDGASFVYADYGQTPTNVDPRNPASMGDPANEGGALRSQDLLSSGDPVTLDGSIIRINPATGAAMPDNPLASSTDANAQRIIAEGLRNPFRIAFRPGTNELWVADVGWNDWEEINRLVSPTTSVKNFGWPAYEGNGPQAGYQSANLPLLQPLYANPSLVTGPYYTYAHSNQVVPGSGEPTGGSSISGLAFYTGTSYPSQYQGALFFSDYSRNWIWAMLPGADGLPDPNNRVSFVANAAGPVNLEIGPNGDLFYVGFNDGAIHRIQFVSSNRAPVAAATASPTGGPAPLTVQFDGSGSSDPDAGTTLSYAWDLDGDGQFNESTASKPTWTYTTAGDHVASLRVSDGQLSSVATATVHVGNTAPTAVIDLPLDTLEYEVGQVIAFSGHATDPEQGTLPASALTWSVIVHHNTHTHPFQTFPGVASGSFVAPDHDYPSYLELVLTATDAGGLSSTTSVILNPQTVDLTFLSNLPGTVVGLNAESVATPFSRTVILGSNNGMSAPPTLPGTGGTYVLSWSDGGAATHNFIADGATSYTANYVLVPTVSVSDASVTEGNLGTTDLTFALTLSAPTTRAVSVNWATADGTATAGVDYVAVPAGTVTFDAGQTSKTVKVTVRGDTLVEPNETLLVNLTAPVNVTLGDAQGVGTIVNDDVTTVLGTEGFGYQAETATYEAIDLVPGAPGVFTILNSGDNTFKAVNLLGGGSTFNFYGTTYTRIYVSSNGLITFGSGNSSAVNTNLTAGPSQRSIAVLWNDWVSTAGQPMILGKYEDLNGDGINDRLIIEWNNVKHVGSPNAVTFQAILSLNTGSTPGEVVFNYVNVDTGDANSNASSATVGIKDAGAQGANRLLVAFEDAANLAVRSGKAVRMRYTR